jgi:hypothetical protein
LLGLAGSGPLWLGPAAEHLAGTQRFVDGVVATSPLTYLAVLAGLDYLRTSWFYEHCALGSLRYAYPSALSLTIGYAVLAAALTVVRRITPPIPTSKEERQ